MLRTIRMLVEVDYRRLPMPGRRLQVKFIQRSRLLPIQPLLRGGLTERDTEAL